VGDLFLGLCLHFLSREKKTKQKKTPVFRVSCASSMLGAGQREIKNHKFKIHFPSPFEGAA